MKSQQFPYLYNIFYFFCIWHFGGIAQTHDSLPKKIIKARTTQSYHFKDGTTRIYAKPKFKDIFYKLPKDFLATTNDFIAQDHAWYLAGTIVSTAILVPVDQKIIDNTRQFAAGLGLSEKNSYGKLGPLENIPKNLGAGFYLFGNGTTVIVLGTGFLTYGLLKNDYRAQVTSAQLMESLLLSGVFVQTIKRITGRESPFKARENGNPGGDWNPFPSFAAYAKNTPSYDAMPSGHLTTIMAALTVIIKNYPDYKWVKPVGYALLGGLCFQMTQSEVHWASDYPIALFMGYFIGKSISKNGYQETNKIGANNSKTSYDFTASRQFGYNSVGLSIKF